MLGINLTTAAAPVKPDYIVADYIMVALPPLMDGTPVIGLIGSGSPIGVEATWRGIHVGTGFTLDRKKPYVDLYFDDPTWIIEKQFPVATWSQRRKRLEEKMPKRMAALIEHNIIEQIIERAKAWTPELFT
jgi:hypothetical protein